MAPWGCWIARTRRPAQPQQRRNLCGVWRVGWSHELPAADFAGKVRTLICGVSLRARRRSAFRRRCSPSSSSPTNCPSSNDSVSTATVAASRSTHVGISSKDPAPATGVGFGVGERGEDGREAGDSLYFLLEAQPCRSSHRHVDEIRIRAGLRAAFPVTRGCRVEAMMKDNHTIGNNPQNVIRWCQIARGGSRATMTLAPAAGRRLPAATPEEVSII